MERNGVAYRLRYAMVGAGGTESVRDRVLNSLYLIFLQISKRYIQISDLANKAYN